MINKIGRFFAWLFVAVLGLYWLRRDAKQDAKRDANEKVLSRVDEAKQVEQDIDRLTPDERRERLRNGRK